MAQQRTLATAAAAHNDEDFPGLDTKRQVVLNHETPIGHGQVVIVMRGAGGGIVWLLRAR